MCQEKPTVCDVICPVCESHKTVCESKFRSKRPFLECETVRGCRNCGVFFAHPIPSISELDSYYEGGLYYDIVSDPTSPDFVEFSYKISESRLRLISKEITLNHSLKVLDLGAGSGQFGKALKEMIPQITYHALDPDRQCYEFWGSWVDERFTYIDELLEETYDLIIMNQVLEHVSKPIEFLNRIFSLITTKGLLYIDVPNGDHRFKPSLEPHILFWSETSLRRACEIAGFDIVFCETAGMKLQRARTYFGYSNGSTSTSHLSPWHSVERFNSILRKWGISKGIDKFFLFQSDKYGGDRIWIRCIAQKIN